VWGLVSRRYLPSEADTTPTRGMCIARVRSPPPAVSLLARTSLPFLTAMHNVTSYAQLNWPPHRPQPRLHGRRTSSAPKTCRSRSRRSHQVDGVGLSPCFLNHTIRSASGFGYGISSSNDACGSDERRDSPHGSLGWRSQGFEEDRPMMQFKTITSGKRATRGRMGHPLVYLLRTLFLPVMQS
jgi:hypothetical protein